MATITPDSDNRLFHLAAALVIQSSRNIFLTGKAGSGKTTFLKYIRQSCSKQMAVLAPTGVAAINAGGVTIHSFFQLPISPFIPVSAGYMNQEANDRHSLLSRLKLTNEKKKMMQELELLIIDEVSMVRCDTLDAMDAVLRHVRDKPRLPFGGAQVLLIGDLFQLPPVIPEQEWQILSSSYDGPYFFDSRVIREEPLVHIEFSKIYRQSEERFLELLNQVRNNNLDESGIQTLNSRLIPDFKSNPDEGYIILTTHNRYADNINEGELKKIRSETKIYQALIEEEFPERSYPAEIRLQLKVGARVIFLKNDPSERGRRYFNGKIGTITRMDGDNVFVQCQDETDAIEVSKEKWEHIRYTLDKKTRKLEEEVLGSFTQFPLRLAWAITIHKSQGLTFEKAIIDAGEAFAPGQVYVALSRCTNLSGMVLKSRINRASLYCDRRVIEFARSRTSTESLNNFVDRARKEYWIQILMSVFDFSRVKSNLALLIHYVQENRESFQANTGDWLSGLMSRVVAMNEVGLKFETHLNARLEGHSIDSPVVQSRIKDASRYFAGKLEEIMVLIDQSPAETDSKLQAKEFNDQLKEVFTVLALKKHLLLAFEKGYTIEIFHQQKSGFVSPTFRVNAYAASSNRQSQSPHPVLHQQLRQLRDSICAKKNLPVYMVVSGKAIDEMAQYLPQTLEELKNISGIGRVKVESYGQQFLDIVIPYCKRHGLSSKIMEKAMNKADGNKKPSNNRNKKTDTKLMSYELFRNGKTVDRIAKERGLSTETILGHLSFFVGQGMIGLEQVLDIKKLESVKSVINKFPGESIASLRQKAGSNISYGEIRLALSWYQSQQRDGITGLD